MERVSAWSETIAQKVIELEPVRVTLGRYLVARIQEISDITYDVCYRSVRCLYTGDIRTANSAIETYGKVQDAEEKLQKAICLYFVTRLDVCKALLDVNSM